MMMTMSRMMMSRMGMEAAVAMVVAVAVSVVLQGSVADAAPTKHVVGGATGWTIPPNASFYSDWSSSSQPFAVGDTLVFNFPTGIHNVMEVPKSGYDGCSTQGKLGATLTTGPATVTLTSPGAHYYLCGVPTHCSFGQKLAVTVSAAAAAPAPGPAPSSSPPPSPSPSKAAPTAPPPGGPAPEAPTPPSAPAPASPPPGGSSAAAPSSSSSGLSALWLPALLATAAAAAAAGGGGGGFAQHY